MKFQRNILDYFKLWQLLWQTVWNLSEYLNIGLGRFAPWIFGQMIKATHWCKPNKQNEADIIQCGHCGGIEGEGEAGRCPLCGGP